MKKTAKGQSAASVLADAIALAHGQPPELKTISIKSIKIDAEFRLLIPPLAAEELQLLEEKIKSEGCRDPLVLWEGKNILLDGHHRHDICKRHGIKFKTVTVKLADREAAADWIDANQLGRRNLKPDQFSLLLGRRYERMKKQGERTDQTCGQIVHKSESAKTAKRLAKQHGVNEKTVRRAGKFAAAVEKVKAVDPAIERKVSEGKAPPKSAVIKSAELIEQDPNQAKAVLEGTVTVAQMEGVVQPDAADSTVNETASGDTAEMIVQRAVEANEAVLALGDKLISVRPETRNSLHATWSGLSALWKRLFGKTASAAPHTSGAAELATPVADAGNKG